MSMFAFASLDATKMASLNPKHMHQQEWLKSCLLTHILLLLLGSPGSGDMDQYDMDDMDGMHGMHGDPMDAMDMDYGDESGAMVSQGFALSFERVPVTFSSFAG